MNKILWIPGLIASAILATNAFAHGGDRDGWNDRGWRGHHHARGGYWRPAPVVVVAPPVVYPAPPAVVYRPRPVYYEPRPVYYGASAGYAPYPARDIAGPVIGAVAGGVIGHQIGDGRLGPTAIGAAVGSVVGGAITGQRW